MVLFGWTSKTVLKYYKQIQYFIIFIL
jgi:hypothetical protein